MTNKEAILSPPQTKKVVVGGREFTLGEARMRDLTVIFAFINRLSSQKEAQDLAGSILRKMGNTESEQQDESNDLQNITGLLEAQPQAISELLSAILATDSSEAPELSAWLMEQSVSEVLVAFTAWMEVNANFLVAHVFPALADAIQTIGKVMDEHLSRKRGQN